MSIKIIFLFIIIYQLVRAIERQHCPDVTDKDCGLAKGSKCQHKHVFACHQSSCSMNFYRRNSTQGEIPWAVLVFNLAQFSVCTGSILNERWVLTAAHCLLHTKARHVEIYLGTKPALFNGPSYKVKQIKLPYLYRNDPTMGVSYDIALLELSKPIVFGPDVCSVCLPPLMYEHGEKETALFSGYGIYDKGGILQSGWVSFNRSHMYDNPYERAKDGLTGLLRYSYRIQNQLKCSSVCGEHHQRVVILHVMAILVDHWFSSIGKEGLYRSGY